MRRIYSLILLTCVLTTAAIGIDTRIAQAGFWEDIMCRVYPQNCRDKDPDGDTPRSHDNSGVPNTLIVPTANPQSKLDTYIKTGRSYWEKQQYSLAKSNFNRAVKIAISIKAKKKEALGYVGLGEVNVSLGNKDKAVAYFNRAIKIFRGVSDDKSANIVRKRLNEIRQKRVI